MTPRDKLFRFDRRTFLEKFAAMGRHRAWEYTTNISMVGTSGDVEDYFGPGIWGEGRGDDGYIGKMSAAKKGMVRD